MVEWFTVCGWRKKGGLRMKVAGFGVQEIQDKNEGCRVRGSGNTR
jgi:hypothetical protein